MSTPDLLKIQLTGPQATVSPCHWHLDDSFFESLDEDEIQHGALDVTCHIQGCETQRVFNLNFTIEGTIEYPCNRCLELMTVPISAKDSLRIVLGDEYEDDGETITIPADSGEFDASWNVYEMIALAIPINPTHPEGQCDAKMLQILQAYQPSTSNETLAAAMAKAIQQSDSTQEG